ncbi:PhzF family phenazine biosynthesis protein [Nocardiopsis composta]|uniref:Putative PhzF superfamily epimerase YddE/YHI9 n=1 Tax=Nocardiopsis composta TaxID=157465 RepID=A0A7W8QMS6_9ACTN|nr:PhzF family phenazine biosynthesis protein [Nocardiopsis composta]MBB5433318.1 putative PhzF superfamily epimerase YddE/YHI9 [Nocardiopsis composta]
MNPQTIPESAVELHVVRVFCGDGGAGGNPLGIVPDGAAVPGRARRRALADRLGFSETVFVDGPESGAVDIYTPGARLPFAGHPLLGVAWRLRRTGLRADRLLTEAGPVPAWEDGGADGTGWIRARPEWASGRRTERFGSVAELEALPGPPAGEGWLYAWAWLDEPSGRVRARGFPRRPGGVAEDEATGAAAIVLTAELGRQLDIHQGRASLIRTRPGPDGTVEVGGRVLPVEARIVEA